MSWITTIWSMGAGACLTLAVIQFAVWWKDRTARANLVFSVMAVAMAIFAALELALMRAETPEQFGMSTRVRRSNSILRSANLEGDSSSRVDVAQGRRRDKAIR